MGQANPRVLSLPRESPFLEDPGGGEEGCPIWDKPLINETVLAITWRDLFKWRGGRGSF